MQEIEFRGKTKNGNKWVYGDLISPENNNNSYSIFEKNGGCVKVKPNTVGQYTGREDKNGKKIFGGDIVTYINTQDFVYEVGRKMCGWIEYDEDNCCWFCKNSFQHHTMWVYGDDIEVIGNIWDNPELLEVNNDN